MLDENNSEVAYYLILFMNIIEMINVTGLESKLVATKN